jgi:hypothetical protein
MEIEVVIPVVRPWHVEGLLYCFARNNPPPDAVTLVTNELPDSFHTYGLHVRVIRFTSNIYPFGVCDVALRRNIGIWSSEASHVLFFDDDQLAPPDLIDSVRRVLNRKLYVWGHYRYIDFEGRTADEILELPFTRGSPRERPPNAFHGWMSAYGGLFACERALLCELGGFDMAYAGRHSGEDQNLARRLARQVDRTDRIFVHEPPFAWHPTKPEPWGQPRVKNVCDVHDWRSEMIAGREVRACSNCPAYAFEERDLLGDSCLLPFDEACVDIEISTLHH